MNLEQSLQRIRHLMSLFVTEVKTATAMQYTDINKVSENVLIPIIATVYGYENLKNLNSTESMNFPSIDLGDETARVTFQVTSTSGIQKVKDTLNKFIEHKLYEKYDRLIIYILTEKQNSYSSNEINNILQGKFKFDTKNDIWDYRNILEEVNKLPLERTSKVESILETNFGEKRKEPEWEVVDKVEQIVNEHTQLFVGRLEESQKLDNYLANNSSGIMLVTGSAGCGKTALLANWVRSIQQNKSCFIAYHFFSERYKITRYLKSAYHNLLRQIYDYYEPYSKQMPNDVDDLRAALYNLLREGDAREDKPLILVIDALDELDNISIPLSPPFPIPLPKNVFVIASARANKGEEPKYLENWIENSQKLHLERLSRAAIKEWLQQTGNEELATFADDAYFVTQLDEITQGFPLYLNYLIDELSHVAKQGQDVRSILAKTPKGFDKYVKLQLQHLDELDLPDELLHFFALLSIAKGVLEKEDVKVITGMRDRQLRQLNQCWQVTRWMRVLEGNLYVFCHPLLGTTFASQLGDDAEDALQKLINYCSNWEEHQSLYALRHYAEHLRDMKQWDDLYKLLHNFEFIGSKVNHPQIGVEALIKDYYFIDDVRLSTLPDCKKQTIKALKLIQQALQLSAHILTKDVKQLPGQLLGRFLDLKAPEIKALQQQILQTKSTWLRPLTASLTSPDEPLIRTLSGHSGSVLSVAVNYDIKKVISGSQDGTIKIWDLNSGYLIRTIFAHNDSVNTVTISHDGLYIISGSHDKSIKVWELETGESVRILAGHYGSINAILLTHDGSKIISASSDCSLKVWNLENGEVLHTLIGHCASVQAFTIVNINNKNLLISGSYNDTLKVWNLETGKEEFTLGEIDMIWSIVAIPDKKLVICGSLNGIITVWNIQTWKKEDSFNGHSNSVCGMSVTSDEKRIISVSEDKTLKIWKIGTWENEATIDAHTDSVLAVAVTSDGKKIISGSGSFISKDYTIKIWNLEKCIQKKLFDTEHHTKTGHSDSIEVVAFTPDAEYLISAAKDDILKLWKIGTWKNEATFIGESKSAITLGNYSNYRAFELKAGDVECVFYSNSNTLLSLLATTTDGKLQIFANDETIKIWDVSVKKFIACFTGESEIKCCAIASDEQTIAVGEKSGRLHFLQLSL